MTESQSIDNKEKFIHRDLSWLAFNQRVLEESMDLENPLMERLRFLAIFVRNLDEFLMVRVAGLRRLLDSQYNKKDSFGYYPPELFQEIKTKIDELRVQCHEIYQGKLKKEMAKHKVFLKKYEDLTPHQQKSTKQYFDKVLFPIVTPLAVDQGHPFPLLPSKTLAFAVSLTRQDQAHFAIVPVPKAIPRLVRLPSESDELNFILVEDVIRQYLQALFRGFKVADNVLFRLMRDSELIVSEEDAPDLLKAIENELRNRPKAKIVSLEIEKNCHPVLLEIICRYMEFLPEEVTRIESEFDFSYLFEMMGQVSGGDLFYPGYLPVKVPYENIFEKIKEGDFILHLPFYSFEPTVDLIRAAARDPNVLAIKMTLYRTNEDSRIVAALKEAAKSKKQVTVLVEIKARFDEEKNIHWVRELEEAGCHVVYGIPGMKIHSKISLIVRKEEDRIRRYVHLSTGNYNENTAKLYTDIGYFTANDDFAHDISDVFNVITGYCLPSRWKRIICSPYDLRQYFFELADAEIEFQKKYKNGLIFAKMNALEDPKIIEKLYEASCAGVKIKLIVRGICCLIPGVKGLSENIEVKSIVGRFLEHSRIYRFHNNGDDRIFVASADWMQRSFDRRIELLFEISKQDLKESLLNILDFCWKDTAKTRWLQPDKTYVHHKNEKEKFNVQDFLIKHYADSNTP
ncbi:MAG: polyphosphate kinase 1 [Candidatus Omnitrophica bacterium]|nr:polyphosphate kinase 1 [Candidatus Omnitrophota bacterium]